MSVDILEYSGKFRYVGLISETIVTEKTFKSHS